MSGSKITALVHLLLHTSDFFLLFLLLSIPNNDDKAIHAWSTTSCTHHHPGFLAASVAISTASTLRFQILTIILL